MDAYRFDFKNDDQEQYDALINRVSKYVADLDDARFDGAVDEIVVTAESLEQAHSRAKQITQAATEGTDGIYAPPEPQGQWLDPHA